MQHFVFIAVAGLMLLSGCQNDPKRTQAKESPTTSTTPAAPLDADAADTVATMREVYPLACRGSAADWKWAKCHDETKGYEPMLRCAEQAHAQAQVAKSEFKPTNPTSACGHAIALAARDFLAALAPMLAETVEWLRAHRAQLAPAMMNKSLHEACDSVDCAGMPGAFGKYEKASFVQLGGLKCTSDLFQCGGDQANVCAIQKVAARLSLACDPSENKPGDPLLARATGRRLNP
jgi:hypothetical protein